MQDRNFCVHHWVVQNNSFIGSFIIFWSISLRIRLQIVECLGLFDHSQHSVDNLQGIWNNLIGWQNESMATFQKQKQNYSVSSLRQIFRLNKFDFATFVTEFEAVRKWNVQSIIDPINANARSKICKKIENIKIDSSAITMISSSYTEHQQLFQRYSLFHSVLKEVLLSSTQCESKES